MSSLKLSGCSGPLGGSDAEVDQGRAGRYERVGGVGASVGAMAFTAPTVRAATKIARRHPGVYFSPH